MMRVAPLLCLVVLVCATVGCRVDRDVPAQPDVPPQPDVPAQPVAAVRPPPFDDDELLIAAVRIGSGYQSGEVLAGTVIELSGDWLTLSVTANPGNVDIQRVLDRKPPAFVVYRARSKVATAEAVRYDRDANTLRCRILAREPNATLALGDRASTTP